MQLSARPGRRPCGRHSQSHRLVASTPPPPRGNMPAHTHSDRPTPGRGHCPGCPILPDRGLTTTVSAPADNLVPPAAVITRRHAGQSSGSAYKFSGTSRAPVVSNRQVAAMSLAEQPARRSSSW